MEDRKKNCILQLMAVKLQTLIVHCTGKMDFALINVIIYCFSRDQNQQQIYDVNISKSNHNLVCKYHHAMVSVSLYKNFYFVAFF